MKFDARDFQEKLIAVIETAYFDEKELFGYCFAKGYSISEIRTWRDVYLQAHGEQTRH
ncbi:hypothetical protein SAMN04487969_105168 [Paenibacillus algorifonticola]|uniref:Uncharacterized protein n=1 Tax=Paenibacillus algorifonticola TaxID=684063 RepID=A0A1I2CNF2_9BACL|nr:hypothetical protein [Paenibacillus algorifonticola]SFE69652.1 hypothetical protein SAMN04487969_105168 [Paenibacillus algorifonticola]